MAKLREYIALFDRSGKFENTCQSQRIVIYVSSCREDAVKYFNEQNVDYLLLERQKKKGLFKITRYEDCSYI
jgi:hypothetical protein